LYTVHGEVIEADSWFIRPTERERKGSESDSSESRFWWKPWLEKQVYAWT